MRGCPSLPTAATASSYSWRDVASRRACPDPRSGRRQKNVWNPVSPLMAKSTVTRSQPSSAILFMWSVRDWGLCALWVHKYSISAMLPRVARFGGMSGWPGKLPQVPNARVAHWSLHGPGLRLKLRLAVCRSARQVFSLGA
jgi:hypothetical protein